MRFLVWLACIPFHLIAQSPSKEEAQAVFLAHIDSVLAKEVKQGDYTFSNFSALQPVYRYPDQLIALAMIEEYATADEYYAAFLYRNKYGDNSLDPYAINKKIKKIYQRLIKKILDGITRGAHYYKKEDKLRKQLLVQLNRNNPPLSSYRQDAYLSYTHQGKTEETAITIIYSIALQVEAYGRRLP
jgi:hypothetical protein